MFYTIIKFPLGNIFLAKTNKGLSVVRYAKSASQIQKLLDGLREKAPEVDYHKGRFYEEEKLFFRYFRGQREDFTSLPVDFLTGTPYQKKVWLEARKIPYGKTETYKSLALRLNHRGYRSVGQALSRNPLLMVIPCHRVIGSDGSLGGFSAGLELKDYLLRMERSEIPA